MVKHISIATMADIFGVENIKVFYPTSKLHSILGLSYTTSDDETVVVEGKFREGVYNRDVRDGYKCIIDPIDTTFAYGDFYVSDLESLISEKLPMLGLGGIYVGDLRIPVGFQETILPEVRAKAIEVFAERTKEMSYEEQKAELATRPENFFAKRDAMNKLENIMKLLDMEIIEDVDVDYED